MPLIALEGVDGSGKSTLAKELQRRCIDASIIPIGVPSGPETAIDECINPLTDYSSDQRRTVILDRAGWGCPVYGPIYRPHLDHDGYAEITLAGWRYVELFMQSRGCTTVLVDAEPKTAAERCVSRGEDYINVDDIDRIVSRYRDLYNESLTGEMTIRLEKREDTVVAARDIFFTAQKKAAAAQDLSPFHHYVGPIEPEILVLCKPDRAKRVSILDEMMSSSDWKSIGFASSAVTAASLTELWYVLGQPSIVCVDVPNYEQLIDSITGGSKL